ncbi:hypothetical protein OKW29_001752 [Paraburkholderia sp. CI3]
MLDFARRHIGVEQTRMQSAEFLTQADQFVLAALVLPAQDLAQQGRRTRCRLVALHACLAQPARERWLDHQQPCGEPRVIVELSRAGKLRIEAPNRTP